MCGSCYDKWLKLNNVEYRKKQSINTSNWFRINPEKRAIYNRIRREKQLADPLRFIKRRNSVLKSKYGIDQTKYEEMLATQNGTCAICFRAPGNRPLHVDHCHKTGKVRGLLCHQCNWYLGTVDSDPSVLERLRIYRDKSNEKDSEN